ncbi:SUR7 protein [Phlyctema vagabunda]|uniref:SUR7 protein n=1 Tax=Phlyctema vagabunda TaxID=108571 RepID=A0ABR4P5V7_9HELO
MGAGRFLCVALPFGLTFASLVCILIAMLAGITNKNLDMFELKTANLSISVSSLENLIDLTRREAHFSDTLTSALNSAVSDATGGDSNANITASDLGLADEYKVSLWNYCAETGSNRNCTSAKFDWAAKALNTTDLDNLASATGTSVTLPKEVKTALKTFSKVSKWTQVVYIIAVIATAAELFLGFFAMCSRMGSCCTFIVSGFSSVAIIAASIMATAMSSVVVGSLNTVTKAYGVKANLNRSFLITTWMAVAFSLGAGIFWMATICCCASDHSSRKSSSAPKSSLFNRYANRNGDAEKTIPVGAYQRVQDPHDTSYVGQQHGIYNPQATRGQEEYGMPMHNVRASKNTQGYEPYSHTAI